MRHRRALAVLACVLAAGAVAGCARSVFPPGGPLDTIPPKIIAVTPADSTVQVARDAGVELLFSEPMDHATVRDGIRVYPPPGRPRLDWSGRRVRVTWDEPLADSTTYVLLVTLPIEGFVPALIGALVVSIISYGLSLFVGVGDDKKKD